MLVPKLRRSVGPAFGGVLEAALKPRIVLVYASLVAWSAACVFVGWSVGLWVPALLKDTVIIVLAFGFPMMFHAIQISSGGALLKRVIRVSIDGTALLVFYLNLASFPLWAELIIQPVVTLLVLLNFVAAREERSRKLVPFFSILLTAALLGSLAWTTTTVITNWEQTEWSAVFVAFLLTLWLPAFLIPFFYVVAFAAHAESTLTRLRFLARGKQVPLRVHIAFVLGLRFSVELAGKFKGRYNGLSTERTFRGAARFMRGFREDVKRRAEAEAERIATLEVMAGEVGTDPDGAQLDRREFCVTKSRLRWIATTQSSRYEMNGQRYWDDLTDWMVDATRHGLPENHGFITQVSGDGQRWRSWRQMPSGWYLGIGGAAGEGEFFFAGSEPPRAWPGVAPEWASDLRNPELPRDWEKSDDPVR